MIYNPVTATEGKKPFAVCCKGLYFPTDDLSLRLVEWIEVQRALGADKISLSILEVHPNMLKVIIIPPEWYDSPLNVPPQVLDYYVQSGYMEVMPLRYPENQPLHLVLQKATLKRSFEKVPLNDCFYRNIYRLHRSISGPYILFVFRYDYIAVVDIDEVIMPLQHNNWNDLFREIKRKTPKASNNISTFVFRHVQILYEEEEETEKDIPEWLHMMSHMNRTVRYLPATPKSFHSTERTQVVLNHNALSCLGPCKRHLVNISLAQLHHYRRGCPTAVRDCSEHTEKVSDTGVWRIRDPVITNSLTTLRNINIPTKG